MQVVVSMVSFLAMFVSVITAQQPGGCPLSGADEKFLIQRRMQGLRANLLAQLGLSGNINISTANRTVSKENMDTFLALTQAANTLEEESQRKCQSEEIYAQPITTIVGRVEDSSKYRNRRNIRNVYEQNVLSTINLEFDFNLKETLTSITRADLLLYQLSPSNDDYIFDGIQYVEIKAVLESIGLKTVVAAKNLNIYNEGFQAFDILSAAKLWIQRQINGTVHLEITITCLGSKRCAEVDNGKIPTSIKFDLQSSTRKPRLVIISQNPLEVTNGNRFRRQSEKSGVSFCIENQSTCCLKNLTIDFAKDLGMDFVLLPKTFEANYCEGICPISPGGDLMTPELYTFITKLSNNPAASIEPCCAGSKFKPLVVILADETNPTGTVIEQFQQVTVDSCRCA